MFRNQSEFFFFVNEIKQKQITSIENSVERASKTCSVRINPRKAAITLSTLHIHATASMGKSPHLFLR